MATLSNEYVTALFELDGETMIGTFITVPSATTVGAGCDPTNGMFTKMLRAGDDDTIQFKDYYFVRNPAKIVFDLRVPTAGTAELKWDIVPFFYGAVKVADGSRSTTDVVVAYKKDRVSISDATSSFIDSDILSAYNEII